MLEVIGAGLKVVGATAVIMGTFWVLLKVADRVGGWKADVDYLIRHSNKEDFQNKLQHKIKECYNVKEAIRKEARMEIVQHSQEDTIHNIMTCPDVQDAICGVVKDNFKVKEKKRRKKTVNDDPFITTDSHTTSSYSPY